MWVGSSEPLSSPLNAGASSSFSTSHTDAFHPVCFPRLTAVVGSTLDDDGASPLDRLAHFTCPSLPHFIALLCRPSPTCLPDGTIIVVIDAVSALLNQAFPKSVDSRTIAKGNNGAGVFPSHDKTL